MTESQNSLSKDEASEQGVSPQENLTHVIEKGGFKSLEANRKLLMAKGVSSTLVCPPGTNLNG